MNKEITPELEEEILPEPEVETPEPDIEDPNIGEDKDDNNVMPELPYPPIPEIEFPDSLDIVHPVEALSVESKIVNALQIRIELTDGTVVKETLVVGSIHNFIYVKNGKVHTTNGRVSDIRDNFITLDYSEKFEHKTVDIQISMIRMITPTIELLK